MCTLAAKKINNGFLIFKTRDLKQKAKTKVVKETGKVKKLLIVDENGHCEGLNEFGIGIIEATLKPYPPIKYPDSSLITRRLLNKKSIEEALEVIKKSRCSFNSILSDGQTAFIVEKTPNNFAITRLRDSGVIANLSLKLSKKNGSKLKEVRLASKTRLLRGKEIVKNINNLNDIKKFLSDKKGHPLYSICRGKESVSETRCAFIYDLKAREIFFCPTSPDQGFFAKHSL
jgi:hypothetical protein